jgi:predicted glycosyltransferase
MRPPAVLFHVQHLLGIGHLMRAREISRALALRGFDVHLVSGGMPVPGELPAGVRLVQLPPLRVADATFRPLCDAAWRPIDDAYRDRRRALLLDTFDAAAPAVVLTETYPFGRRALRFELDPLLERCLAAQPRPLILASVRDVLQRQPAARSREMLERAHDAYDGILVHSDPRFVRFEESFADDAPLNLAPPLHYTGFVAAADDAPPPLGERDEIVVSAGGGAVGEALVTAALAARGLSRYREHRWRVLVGHNVPDQAFAALVRSADTGVIVERARPDFRAILARALVSVSQAGYNTVLDVLQSGAAAVFVPFAASGQTEQPTRAARLARLALAFVVDESTLDARSLANAIDEAGSRGSRAFDFDTDGARRAAEIVARLLSMRAGASSERVVQ